MAETKEFKAESKRLLEMMINSIYTHKEIFLRELISNASDAMDKLYFKSMSENTGITRSDMAITIEANKDDRKLIITDNGIGMTKDELENNLGTIAKSGSLAFKNENEDRGRQHNRSVRRWILFRIHGCKESYRYFKGIRRGQRLHVGERRR